MGVIYDSTKRIYTLRGKYKNAEGKWVNYERITSDFQFKKKNDALAADNKLRKELSNYSNKKGNVNQQTFKDVVDEYFKDKKRTIKATTIQTDSNALKMAKHISSKIMCEITANDIQTILDDMDDNNYSLNYIEKIRSNIGKIFNYACSKRIIEKNPMDDVKTIKRPNEVREEFLLFWEPHEFAIFISNIFDLHDKTFFSFLYYTGCRKGEALALTWNDINFDQGTFKINKTCSQSVGGKHFLITPPKTQNSVRTKLMPKVLIDLMLEFYNQRSKLYSFNKKCFVFGSLDRPFPTTTLNNHFRKYQNYADGWVSKKQLIHGTQKNCEAFNLDDIITLSDGIIYNNSTLKPLNHKYFGELRIDKIYNISSEEYQYHVTLPITKINVHGLRHSHASFLINNGGKIKAIAERLGDTVEVLLKTYSHLFRETDTELISIIDNSFYKKSKTPK